MVVIWGNILSFIGNVVALADGGEVLLPAIKDCILSVDMEKREMQVHVLDGLL